MWSLPNTDPTLLNVAAEIWLKWFELQPNILSIRPQCTELLPCEWPIRYLHQWAVEQVSLIKWLRWTNIKKGTFFPLFTESQSLLSRGTFLSTGLKWTVCREMTVFLIFISNSGWGFVCTLYTVVAKVVTNALRQVHTSEGLRSDQNHFLWQFAFAFVRLIICDSLHSRLIFSLQLQD